MSLNYRTLCNALCSLQEAREGVRQLLQEKPGTYLYEDAERQLINLQDQLLTEAKNTLASDYRSKNPDELSQNEIVELRDKHQKIPAIKLIRERTGCGLKEAKDAAERWMLKNLGYTSFITY